MAHACPSSKNLDSNERVRLGQLISENHWLGKNLSWLTKKSDANEKLLIQMSKEIGTLKRHLKEAEESRIQQYEARIRQYQDRIELDDIVRAEMSREMNVLKAQRTLNVMSPPLQDQVASQQQDLNPFSTMAKNEERPLSSFWSEKGTADDEQSSKRRVIISGDSKEKKGKESSDVPYCVKKMNDVFTDSDSDSSTSSFYNYYGDPEKWSRLKKNPNCKCECLDHFCGCCFTNNGEEEDTMDLMDLSATKKVDVPEQTRKWMALETLEKLIKREEDLIKREEDLIKREEESTETPAEQ